MGIICPSFGPRIDRCNFSWAYFTIYEVCQQALLTRIKNVETLKYEAVPKLQFWNSNLRFKRKSGL
jgi:hypothetical protein